MSVSSSTANYCILSSVTVFYIWNHLQWDMHACVRARARVCVCVCVCVCVALNVAMITEYSISITFLSAK